MSADGTAPGLVVRLAKDGEPEGYRAFTPSRDGKPDFLDVEGRDGSGELLPYRAILSIAYTALQGGAWLVTLTSPGHAVLIEGRHLGELVKRLKLGDVDTIHEFDPQRWPQPPDSEPIVLRATHHAPAPA